MPSTLDLYRAVTAVPGGHRVFSLLYARRARYFTSVRPRVRLMRPHRAEVTVRSRRAVHNHIGTVHVIAICNGLEAAMGLLAEATVPAGHRWLPKGMHVDYLAPASSDIRCIASTAVADWSALPEVDVKVDAVRDDGTVVVAGTITLWVTQKP